MMTFSITSALLDACVLYPAPLRDLLLSFAAERLFKPKWSDKIQAEWTRNLLKNRPDLSENQLMLTINAMNLAFPDANVTGFKTSEVRLEMPDPNDKHVVAAAIQAKVNTIVTSNLKDFPPTIEQELHINIQHPDNFLCNIYEQHPEKALEAFRKMTKRLKNPPKTYAEVLASLQKTGLDSITEKLRSAIK